MTCPHRNRDCHYCSPVAVIVLLIFITCSLTKTDACTVFIVGKDASIDGSVMVSHSNDGEFDTDPRLVKIPAADYSYDKTKNVVTAQGQQQQQQEQEQEQRRPVFFSPESYPRYVGYKRGNIPEYYPKHDDGDDENDESEFIPIGYIPQVPHTFAYLEETYGAVNEHQVGIGESTCSGVFGAIPLGAPNGTALFSIDELTHIAMERATTAKQAIQIMGDLAVEYGFYGAGEFEGTAESLAVSDVEEAWIFHILPDPTGKSAIWAAQKVPSTAFAVLANMFVIRQVDPEDTENFMMSPSVHSVAQEYGWWDPSDGLLDFTKLYSDGEYAHKYYSGRRMWGAYRLASPGADFPSEYVDLQSDPVYPVYTKPDTKLSVQDLFKFHRDTYQGTKFDLGASGNLAAGPFGSPDRWKAGTGEEQIPTGNWERPIGLYRTSDTYVVQSRQQQQQGSGRGSSRSSTGAVLWYGPASALGTIFTPFIVGLSDIPASFRSGHHAKFSRQSAFWAACVVHNVANLKWNYAIHDVQKVQLELEETSARLVQQLEEDYSNNVIDFQAVEDVYVQNAATIVESLWSLSDLILFKYASGFVNEPPDNMSQMVGYPTWWLEAVGYQNGPPPPPTKPKCCHPPPKDNPITTTSTTTTTSGVVHHDHSSTRNNLRDGRVDTTDVAVVQVQPVPPLTGKAAMKEYLRTMTKDSSSSSATLAF